MTDQLDDWEGRLAAMASGVRYRTPESLRRSPRRARPTPRPAVGNTALAADADNDQQTFLAEPCPCDQCELRQRCASSQLACERYDLFMRGQSAALWSRVPATPTKERFLRLAGLMD